jgi:hypothetical protein
LDDGKAETGTPLGVWDTRDRDSIWYRHWRETVPWAAEHIRDVNNTYRAEFYLIDAPFAVLYRYRENGEGRRYIDPATGEPAVEEPVTQMLDSLPPLRLLGVR